VPKFVSLVTFTPTEKSLLIWASIRARTPIGLSFGAS